MLTIIFRIAQILTQIFVLGYVLVLFAYWWQLNGDNNTVVKACDTKVETNTTDEQNPTTQVDITTTPTVTLSSLTLTIEKSSLNKDENTTVKVMATYSDGTSKEVTDKVEWVVIPTESVTISSNMLKAMKDTPASIQAKIGTKLSQKVNLDIYREVNGHKLPPEPDKAINDSTLLGIDVNDNGVRDDVERWIYEEYKDKHPIHIDIAMQAGRAYKKVLETPEKAKEIREVVNGALFCGWYYWKDSYRYNDPTLVKERIDTPVKSKYFNTKERSETYWQYDTLLSGGSYGLPRARQRKSFCDFNTSVYEE